MERNFSISIVFAAREAGRAGIVVSGRAVQQPTDGLETIAGAVDLGRNTKAFEQNSMRDLSPERQE